MAATQHLVPVALSDLHPTQLTVGRAEVQIKRAHWASLKRKVRERELAQHWFPAVRGAGGQHFIVDHHHLGVALHEEGVTHAWVMQLADFSDVPKAQFWGLMEFHRWVHPYDERGRRRSFGKIPGLITGLRDDPYRSLAGLVRTAGGYAKDVTPFSEFLWADFFRLQMPLRALRGDTPDVLPPKAVAQAVALARSPAARHLPGWAGHAAPADGDDPSAAAA